MISESQPEPLSVIETFIPQESFDPQAAGFFTKVAGMLDGQPRDEAEVQAALSGWDEMLTKTASDLYRLGSMLLGGGEETIALIEQVVANLDVKVCSDYTVARHLGRLALAAGAIRILEINHPNSFSAPDADQTGPVSCIEDDDLESAGVTHDDLDRMLNGSDEKDTQHLRSWLESLEPPLRVVFALRAIAGLSTGEIATLLSEHISQMPRFDGIARPIWSPEAVRSCFRQALCSLASQLLHANVTK